MQTRDRLLELGDQYYWVAVFISELEGSRGHSLTYKENSGNILIYEAVIKLF